MQYEMRVEVGGEREACFESQGAKSLVVAKTPCCAETWPHSGVHNEGDGWYFPRLRESIPEARGMTADLQCISKGDTCCPPRLGERV